MKTEIQIEEIAEALQDVNLYVEEPLGGCMGCPLVIEGSVEVAKEIGSGVATVFCHQQWIAGQAVGSVTVKGYVNGKNIGYSEKTGYCQSLTEE